MDKERPMKDVVYRDTFQLVDVIKRVCVFDCRAEVLEDLDEKENVQQIHDLASCLKSLETECNAAKSDYLVNLQEKVE